MCCEKRSYKPVVTSALKTDSSTHYNLFLESIPMKKKTLILFSLLLIVGPWIPVALAGKIVSANGCRFDESQVYPCIVAGQDRGKMLSTMGMMGWLGVMTFMPGVVGMIIGLSMKKSA